MFDSSILLLFAVLAFALFCEMPQFCFAGFGELKRPKKKNAKKNLRMGIFNTSKSSTEQSSEQTSSVASGTFAKSVGKGQLNSNIFGDKNLAKNDFTKPVLIIVGGLLIYKLFVGKVGK